MIFIVVKFPVLPGRADDFVEAVADFTAATRAEEGNLWFEWSRSLADPDEFVLVEAFADDAAEAHVGSEHFAAGLAAMRPLLRETPRIISQPLPGKDGWDRMGELEIG